MISGAKPAQETGAKPAQEAKRTAKLADGLPRGIKIGARPGRPKPFFVRYGAGRVIESFASEQSRNDFADKLWQEKEQNGAAVLDFDPDEWREWVEFKRDTGATVALVRETWGAKRAKLAIVVPDAVETFIHLREGQGHAEDSLMHARTILRRFAAYSEGRLVNAVDSDHIRGWLAALKAERQFSDTTLHHHRKEVNLLFAHGLREGWNTSNPCSAIPPPAAKGSDDVAFLSVEDTAKVFEANAGLPVIGKLALEFFAGLRYTSAGRLVRADLDFQAKIIVLPSSKSKSGKRHVIDGLPANLWKWLKSAPDSAWDLNGRMYGYAKHEALVRAGVKSLHNAARHSFGTYHLNAYKNAPLTAYIMCHRSPAMLYQRYLGRGVSKRNALKYFEVTP